MAAISQAIVHQNNLFIAVGFNVQVYSLNDSERLTYLAYFPFPYPIYEFKSTPTGLLILSGRSAYLLSGGPSVTTMYITLLTLGIDSLDELTPEFTVLKK